MFHRMSACEADAAAQTQLSSCLLFISTDGEVSRLLTSVKALTSDCKGTESVKNCWQFSSFLLMWASFSLSYATVSELQLWTDLSSQTVCCFCLLFIHWSELCKTEHVLITNQILLIDLLWAGQTSLPSAGWRQNRRDAVRLTFHVTAAAVEHSVACFRWTLTETQQHKMENQLLPASDKCFSVDDWKNSNNKIDWMWVCSVFHFLWCVENMKFVLR